MTMLQILKYSNAWQYILSVILTVNQSLIAFCNKNWSPCGQFNIFKKNIIRIRFILINSNQPSDQKFTDTIGSYFTVLNGFDCIGLIIKLNNMFNRHTYERYESLMQQQLKKEQEQIKFSLNRKKDRIEKTEKYKERVRDFLVKMASKPLELGQYIPPINQITRSIDESKNLANAQLYINGFKTNRERLQRAISDNRILDYTPIPVCALNHEFRPRLFEKEMQPGMRFQGQSSPKATNLSASQSSSVKLPAISSVTIPNPETKMHFKGIEQMGNKLKSMQPKESDRIGLLNKLQTVYRGGDINLQRTSLDILKNCKLNRSKTLKIVKSTTFQTQKSR